MRSKIIGFCFILVSVILIFTPVHAEPDDPVSPVGGADKPEVFVQLGHSLGVTSVAFSPDGKYALSGSKDHTLRLWEVTTGKEIRVFKGHSKRVNSMSALAIRSTV